MSVQPAGTEMIRVGAQGSGGAGGAVNPVTARVGQNFTLVPNVFAYEGGSCGQPPLPQKMHIIPTTQPIDTPMAMKAVVNQVIESHIKQPTPLTSTIEQNMCLCLNDTATGLLGNQTYHGADGVELFRFQEIKPCVPCLGKHRISSINAQNQEIGHAEWQPMPCGIQFMKSLCSIVCRTPTHGEWVWLSARDAGDNERLTFRNPAEEGRCIIMELPCCTYQRPAHNNCCAKLPDIPYQKHVNIHGPFPEQGVVGTVDIRGAYGFDRFCLCQHMFGTRPEMTTSVSLHRQLSFEDTVLAMQMGLAVADEGLKYWDYRTGRYARLPWLKPAHIADMEQ